MARPKPRTSEPTAQQPHKLAQSLILPVRCGTLDERGHADIIRESIDGAVGLREGVSNMPPGADAAAWKQHYDVESIARSAAAASEDPGE